MSAIGIIEGQHGKKKNGEHNDRIMAIEEANHSYAVYAAVRLVPGPVCAFDIELTIRRTVKT